MKGIAKMGLADGQGNLDERFDPFRSVNREWGLPSLERPAAEETREPEYMITMQMREEDLFDPSRPDVRM